MEWPGAIFGTKDWSKVAKLRVKHYCADKAREIMIAKAFGEGVRSAGDEFEVRRNGDYGSGLKWEGPGFETDVACFFGVKGRSRQLLRDHRMLGLATLHFDKGYTRSRGEGGHTEYTRISVNAPDPLAYFMRKKRSPERLKQMGITLAPRQNPFGGHILLALSSPKYCTFHGLGDATQYAATLVQRLRKLTDRPIVYRPKPSWAEAVPIPGAAFSHRSSTITDAMRGAYCVVTHGATAAMDAVIAGVPAISLGNSIARPVCGTELDRVADLYWPTDEERMRWAAAVSWTQFSLQEMRSGFAWQHLKEEIEHQCDSSSTIAHSPPGNSKRS